MKYLAIYCYEAPDGTFSEGSPRPKETVAIYGTMHRVLAMLRDKFDGIETFDEFVNPQFLDHFSSKGLLCEVFRYDDHSAGQWISVVQVNPNAIIQSLSL